MSARQFQYALLRVVPDLERGECLNVGLVLFSRPRRFLEARVELDAARLAALAPGLDPAVLESHLAGRVRVAAGDPAAGPVAALAPSERFHWLVAPASTVIQPSPVHTGLCEDPAAELEHLFARLVLAPRDPQVRARGPSHVAGKSPAMAAPTSLPVRNAEPPPALAKVLNPVMKLVLGSPLARVAGGDLMLLTMKGRRSGRQITVPVGRHELDGQLTVVAGGRWRFNLRGGAPVEVVLGGRPRPGRGELVEDPDEVARVVGQLLARVGLKRSRRLGLEVVEARQPTHEELKAALTGYKGVVRIALGAEPRA